MQKASPLTETVRLFYMIELNCTQTRYNGLECLAHKWHYAGYVCRGQSANAMHHHKVGHLALGQLIRQTLHDFGTMHSAGRHQRIQTRILYGWRMLVGFYHFADTQVDHFVQTSFAQLVTEFANKTFNDPGIENKREFVNWSHTNSMAI